MPSKDLVSVEGTLEPSLGKSTMLSLLRKQRRPWTRKTSKRMSMPQSTLPRTESKLRDQTVTFSRLVGELSVAKLMHLTTMT